MVALSGVAGAVEQSGTCRFTRLANRVLAPVDLTFGIGVGSVSASVVVDPEAGRFAVDGASISVPPYDMVFSTARDTIDFADQVFEGTVDAAGTVTVPGVRFVICTGGSPAGTDCVPANLCSNDLTRVCIPSATGGIGCDPGGVCQGVCENDRTRSCAGDVDCPGSRCGNGTLVPFEMDLTTSISTLGTVTVLGSPLNFGTGELTLNDVTKTPPESPIIQDTGVTSLILSCTLDVPLVADALPPPEWVIKKGQVKLGKGGEKSPDETLKVRAVLEPLGGAPDFAADDLVLTLGLTDKPEKPLLFLTVPKGALKANSKGTLLKLTDKTGTVVQVKPDPEGDAAASHTLKLKRAKSGKYSVALDSKGVALDGLTGDQVIVSVTLGRHTGTFTRSAKTKRKSVDF
jgi:hypothetical protein